MKCVNIDLRIYFDEDATLYYTDNADKLECSISELFDDIFCNMTEYIKTEAKIKEEADE